jgi:hypothetical protein
MVYYQSLLRTYNYVESSSDSNIRKSKRRDNVDVDMTAKSEFDTRKMISCAKGDFSE